MDSLIAELERIASSIEDSVSTRDVSKLNDWGKGYHDAEQNFVAGLRERVRQLRAGAADAKSGHGAAALLEQVATDMASRASGYLMRTKDEPDLAQKACGLLEGAGMLRDKAKVIS